MNRKRVAAVLCAALAWTILPAEAASAARPARRDVVTTAVAVVQRDGLTVTDADLDLWKRGRRLDRAANLAVAYARCTDCRGLAVAFQVVLVRRPAPDLQVVNRAVAVTDRCARCEALAYAYQWVVVTGGRQLTFRGRVTLARLGYELHLLVASRPSAARLERGVRELAAQVEQVLATEVRERPVLRVRRSVTRR